MSNRRVSRWRPRIAPVIMAVFAVGLIAANTARLTGQSSTTGWKIVAWNNLGMHCMDADFSVFAILPPYNTIQAQLVDPSGTLVKAPNGINVTYEGVADPTGSINTTSAGKTNFWPDFVKALFGAALPVDAGLAGKNMPGQNNYPQPMTFDSSLNWFIAEGIPITPYDDAGKKNYYPLMYVKATDGTGATIASTNIVLPVSDEMDCRACHASGSGPAARPSAGWVNVADQQRDYRLNILRLHDDRQLGSATYASALAAKGYSSAGLFATATAASGAKAILCAKCHKSEALVGSGYMGIPPLTASMHALHSSVIDPTNGFKLDDTKNRSACYRCHPGSETRCLRGAMGSAVAADGTMAMQCQSCHGSMSDVGSDKRTGWLNEPACQNCHTGTAAQNNGQIRYTSAFASPGQLRTAVNMTFATQDGAPAAGLNLYRFSAGHGGLQCSACHGSTHAEYPSSHPNDNLQSIAVQGHVGTISECTTCHQTSPATVTGGPHGMHPVGSAWLSGHQSAAQSNRTQCQACHGTDYRGTVLSRTFAARTFSVFGGKSFFKGAQIGCYTCHNGPSSESANANQAPVASNVTASTAVGTPVAIALVAADADGNALTLRIVSQPANGTVGLSNATATYYPGVGFSGTDTFTYAAWDGSIDSNLATGTITVGSGGATCTVSTGATAPALATVGVAVQFSGSATASNCGGSVAYDWNFGDGSTHASTANATHTYSAAGTFTWRFTATAGGVQSVRTGTISVGAGCSVTTSATALGSGNVGVPVSFSGSATASNCGGSVAYDWNFGDGSAHASTANATHTYSAAGTFTWTFTATAGGVHSTRSGSISIAAPPSISSVNQFDNPFRLQINGANFKQGAIVRIGGSTTPWANTQFVSSSQLLLSGGGLRQQFPRGVAVQILVVNPDGQSVSTTFTRR